MRARVNYESRLRRKMTCGGVCCVRNHVEVKNEE